MAAHDDEELDAIALADGVEGLTNALLDVLNERDDDYHSVFLSLTTLLLAHMTQHAEDEDMLLTSLNFVSEQLTSIILMLAEKDKATMQ